MNTDATTDAKKPQSCFSWIILGVAIAFALLQVAQLAYRAYLFVVEYHSQPYSNHVDDGAFTLLYSANLVLFALGLLAIWKSAASGSALRSWLIGVTVLNVICCLTFEVMRRNAMLVGYTEFIREMKARHP